MKQLPRRRWTTRCSTFDRLRFTSPGTDLLLRSWLKSRGLRLDRRSFSSALGTLIRLATGEKTREEERKRGKRRKSSEERGWNDKVEKTKLYRRGSGLREAASQRSRHLRKYRTQAQFFEYSSPALIWTRRGTNMYNWSLYNRNSPISPTVHCTLFRIIKVRVRISELNR